jgi:hypothetical protein
LALDFFRHSFMQVRALSPRSRVSEPGSHCRTALRAFGRVADRMFRPGPSCAVGCVAHVPLAAWCDVPAGLEAEDGMALALAPGYPWCPCPALRLVVVAVPTGLPAACGRHQLPAASSARAPCHAPKCEATLAHTLMSATHRMDSRHQSRVGMTRASQVMVMVAWKRRRWRTGMVTSTPGYDERPDRVRPERRGVGSQHGCRS